MKEKKEEPPGGKEELETERRESQKERRTPLNKASSHFYEIEKIPKKYISILFSDLVLGFIFQ